MAVLAGAGPAAAVAGRTLRGTARADLLVASSGPVTVLAGRGDDRIAVQYDGAGDTVRCGPGHDVLTADPRDRVAADCELVSRLVSRDTTVTPDAQHETEVEPSSFAAGRTIVSTFQSGRRHGGGAAGIGFSTSRDGGLTWRGGLLPSLTVGSKPPGSATFASDPVVAFDLRHGIWLISTLAVSSGRTELYVSRSSDGLNWGAPVVAAGSAGSELAYDKNWVACDNWAASPHRGRCYLAYTDHTTPQLTMGVQTSDDGGATWSEEVTAVESEEVVGVLPVPRPDGSLVIPYLAQREMQSVRSTDGGRTFEAPVTIAPFLFRSVRGIRSFPLPAAEADARGRLYVTWQDCRFRSACGANDIVLSTSADGNSWSEPVRATRDQSGTAFVAALAVDHSTGKLALAYHRCSGSPCRIDVLVATSGNGGSSWSRARLVNAQTMRAGWLPTTTSGRMLGDYIGISWTGGVPVAVYGLASAPRGGKLRQAIAAARVR